MPHSTWASSREVAATKPQLARVAWHAVQHVPCRHRRSSVPIARWGGPPLRLVCAELSFIANATLHKNNETRGRQVLLRACVAGLRCDSTRDGPGRRSDPPEVLDRLHCGHNASRCRCRGGALCALRKCIGAAGSWGVYTHMCVGSLRGGADGLDPEPHWFVL